MRKYSWWNFCNTIFFQTSKFIKFRFTKTENRWSILQFNGWFWNISGYFYKIFVFTVDNTVKTCAWIWTYRYIACIIDIINIYCENENRSLLFIYNESIKNFTHAIALFFIIDQRCYIFIVKRISILTSRI